MKKKLLRFNLAALALVLVTSALISGTFAKYTTQVSAQDTALIARWDISSTGMGAETTDMDLFGHAYDVAILNADEGTPILGPGVEDEFTVNLTGTADVDATIDLKIEKLPDSVGAPIQYAIQTGDSFTWDGADIYYSEELLAEAILNTMADKAPDDSVIVNASASKVAATATTAGEKAIILEKNEADTNVDVIVHWRWPFDVSKHDTTILNAAGITGTGESNAWTDADDTALGKASATAFEGGARTIYGLKLTLTAEQITPEATSNS